MKDYDEDFNPFINLRDCLDYSDNGKPLLCDSEEQFLLCVYMFSKYGKRWKNNAWD
jgi:hypothetical protein